MKKYDVILLGGDGFIGSYFYKKYKKKINIFRVKKNFGDLKKKSVWKKLPRSKVLLNLASKVFVPKSWCEIDKFINNNVQITLNSLVFCKKYKTKNIYVSSYLYGDADIPTKEKQKICVNNPYSLSKKIGEDLCKFFSDFLNVKSIILRPFNIYGPNQDKRFLIPSILSQVRKKTLSINDLRPARDLLYVDDFCKLLFKILKFQKKFSIYNVGSGKSYSIRVIIQTIEKLVGYKLKIYNKKIFRKNEIFKTQADIHKVKKNFKWRPETNLFYGLKKIFYEKFSYRCS